MSATDDRAGFEALAQSGPEDAEAARDLAARLKARNGPQQLKALAALWLHVAVAQPEDLAAIYDAAAEGWLGEPVGGPPVRAVAGLRPAAIPAAFWTALWSLIAETNGLGAAGVTARTAALSGLIAPDVIRRRAKAAGAWPGLAAAARSGLPRPFSAPALARCPPGSLGAAFWAQHPDLEVGRHADLPAPLDYVAARIAQTRGLWALTAGYEATTLHEVALYAFQLGQFGHHYAAKYLGMVLTRLAFEQPAGGPLMLQTILTAWTHGRRTPPLIGTRWETLWDKPVDAVRKTLGVTPYASPYPADLFEQAAA